MTEHKLVIDVKHSKDPLGAVARFYDVDTGPLAIPGHLRIGQTSILSSRETITSYAMQVEDYEIWLDEEIKAGNQEVLAAIDDVYNMGINGGVIVCTQCLPSPYITHAHVLMRVIKQLAGIT